MTNKMETNSMVASEIMKGHDKEEHICYDEVRPVPRIKKEAAESHKKNQGTIHMFVFNDKEPEANTTFSYDEIKPVPRVKSEAVDNFNRNKGSLQSGVFKNDQPCEFNQGKKKPRSKPRCTSSASLKNYDLHRNGSIKFEEMYSNNTPRPETAPSPRIKPEALKNARLNSGGRMKSIVNEFGQHRPDTTVQRVKSTGKENAVVHKGGRMNVIFTKYGQENNIKAVPRVKETASKNADLGKGQRMSDILSHKACEPEHRGTPRVKEAAQVSAHYGKGVRMQKIMTSSISNDVRPTPRIKKEGERSARLDQGTRMSNIVHDAQSMPETPKLRRGVRSPDARKIQDYGRGHFGQTLNLGNMNDNNYIVFKPGLQSPHYDIGPAL